MRHRGSITTTINYPYFELNPKFIWKEEGKRRQKTHNIRIYYGQRGLLKSPLTREEACKQAYAESKAWLEECKRLGKPPGVS